MIINDGHFLLLFLLSVCLFTGCANGSNVTKYGPSMPQLEGDHCGAAGDYELADIPLLPPPDESTPFSEPSEMAPLTQDVHSISEVIGVDRLVREIRTLKFKQIRGLIRNKDRLFETRQHLSDRLLLTLMEIRSVIEEAHCEHSRALYVSIALNENQLNTVERHTIFALLGDAILSGIAGGALVIGGSETAAGAVSVMGGLIPTAFVTSLSFKTAEKEFLHKRNLLRDIWEGPKVSTLFPRPVWEFLNAPDLEEGTGKKTRRERLLADWRENDWLGESQSKIEQNRIALFFGDGGIYTTQELQIRAQMLDLLRIKLNLMNRYLKTLIREMLKNPGLS